MRDFEVITAVDQAGGIGKDGGLPWDLPGEMAHFSRTTRRTVAANTRNAVFMGRVNWEATPAKYQPLPGRQNVVLTRRADYPVPEGVLVATSIEDCLTALAEPPYATSIERVFCIGGGNIYRQALELPQCSQLILTRIHATYDCDTFFPAFEDRFAQTEVLGTGEHGGVTWEIQRWHRRGGSA